MFRWRHFVVALGLVPALVVYVTFILQISDFVVNRNLFLDFLFYLFAGLAWIPLATRIIDWLAKHESK